MASSSVDHEHARLLELLRNDPSVIEEASPHATNGSTTSATNPPKSPVATGIEPSPLRPSCWPVIVAGSGLLASWAAPFAALCLLAVLSSSSRAAWGDDWTPPFARPAAGFGLALRVAGLAALADLHEQQHEGRPRALLRPHAPQRGHRRLRERRSCALRAETAPGGSGRGTTRPWGPSCCSTPLEGRSCASGSGCPTTGTNASRWTSRSQTGGSGPPGPCSWCSTASTAARASPTCSTWWRRPRGRGGRAS